MNDVDQVVVLRYDQIRASALRGCTGPQGLSNTVVFPEQMLARLRRRVLELQDEIKQQKQRQKSVHNFLLILITKHVLTTIKLGYGLTNMICNCNK